MRMQIQTNNTEIPSDLLQRMFGVDFPTFGHYLDDGFMDPAIRSMLSGVRIVGRAVTVSIAASDSSLVHRVCEMIEPGDVLVVETGGDYRSAAIGGMVSYAAQQRGCLGIVTDGVCTDRKALEEMRFPVFARGSSILTTKLRGLDLGSINMPVVCGDVLVNPGDLICADDNGVLALSVEEAKAVLEKAEASDKRSQLISTRLAAGENLGDISIANELIARIGSL